LANKHQVLELLAKGLNPQQIAKKLKCSDAYVRATRRRDQVPKYTITSEGWRSPARNTGMIRLFRSRQRRG